MTCTVLETPGGGIAIVCGPRRRQKTCSVPGCGRPSERQCDWKIEGEKTCARHLCATHAKRVGDEKDLCPPHAKVWAVHPKNPENESP